MLSVGRGPPDEVPNRVLELKYRQRFSKPPLPGTTGAACEGRAPKPENFRKFYEKIEIFVAKLRKSTGNRSQMASGYVRGVCDALPRVSALSELQ